MLIKSADDKSAAIEELERLLEEAPRATKASILKELRNLRAGIKGERESAYELDFYISKNNNFALIHDLRLDIDGRVAQIDHLFINRLLEVFVIETKHFSQGLSINERGEFMAWYNGTAVGIASPLSQNDRHIAVLKDAFKNIALPKRLGFTLNPTLNSIVMISKNAKISRPSDEKFDSSNVLKADQFSAWYEKTAAQGTAILAKMVSGETIIDIANKLASMHTPIEFNYREKFGLGATSSGPTQTAGPAERDSPGGRYTCAGCECTLPYAVAKFCWNQKAKFHGKAYCRECQTNGATSQVLTAASAPAVPIAPAQAPLLPPSPPQSPMAALPSPGPAISDPANKYSCAGCPTKVPYAVAKFCWNMKGKFGGKVYCRECQPKVTQGGFPVSPTAPAAEAPTIVAAQPPAPAESSLMVPHSPPRPVPPHPPVTPSPSYVVTIGAANIGSAPPSKAPPAPPPADPANKYACSGCPAKVPYAVAKFCWNQKAKFGGRVFCRDCQKAH